MRTGVDADEGEVAMENDHILEESSLGLGLEAVKGLERSQGCLEDWKSLELGLPVTMARSGIRGSRLLAPMDTKTADS